MFGKKKQNPDLEIFVVYDTKTDSYSDPAFAKNSADLLRGTMNMFNDPQQSNNKYIVNAEDYVIFKCGSFSRQTGEITTCTLDRVAYMHELRAMCVSHQSTKLDPQTGQVGILTT